MVGRLEDLFGTTGLAISGTARVALFIGCLLMMFIEAVGLKNWLVAVHNYYLSSFGFECKGYHLVEELLFLLAGLVGLFAIGKSHLTWLKMNNQFVFLLLSSLIFSVIVQGFTDNSSKLNEEVESISKPLAALLKDYDWSGESKLEKAINATKSWDVTQKVGECCGLDGFKDWDPVKPKHLSKTAYPASCCSPVHLKHHFREQIYCHADELFTIGCRKALKELLWNNRFMAWIWKIFYFVLLLMGIVHLYDIGGE